MPVRTVEVQPPSLRAETLNVLKGAAGIVAIVAAYLLWPAAQDGAVALRPAGLLPYQSLARDLPPIEQRTFTELREGLLEAERLRATTGQWPDVTTLAGEGIPPFDADPTRKGPAHRWTSVRQDWIVNYLGVPSDGTSAAWALVILEPAPGAPPDPAPNDEEHHRLPDGTTLHVTIWKIRDDQRRSGFSALQLPQNEGWTQVMVGSQQ